MFYKKVEADMIFGNNFITVTIDEYVTQNLLFILRTKTQNKETTKMLVINLSDTTMIVVLPNIMSHYHDLFLLKTQAAKPT